MPPGAPTGNTLLVSIGKKELFSPTNGLKGLLRRLKNNWKLASFKDEISLSKISQARVLMFFGPREKFSVSEFEAIKQYVNNGGSVLFMLGEGGESKFDTNINYLLEEYGIMINSDAVIRTNFFKYHHPKECLVSQGVLNREVNRHLGKNIPNSTTSDTLPLSFVYPFGSTLVVQPPAIAILSSGPVSLPNNRPISAFAQAGKGRVAVFGSAHMFQDLYIDKEENGKIFDFVLQYLTSSIALNGVDAENPEVADYHVLPHTEKLADNLRVCLQESEEIPRDFTSSFDYTLHTMDTSLIPDALDLYANLRVKHEHLTLITPQFETPLPPLAPAVFPPAFRDIEPPALDLFDLDETFSSEHVRLAQVTNNCQEEDLEYFVRECGDILGLASKIPAEQFDARHILSFVLRQLVEYKKSYQEA